MQKYKNKKSTKKILLDDLSTKKIDIEKIENTINEIEKLTGEKIQYDLENNLKLFKEKLELEKNNFDESPINDNEK